MNEFFLIKYDELLSEFNRYILTHPDFLSGIPNEAVIVLLDPDDLEFNRYSMERTKRALQNDDILNRPIVYMDDSNF